MSELKLILDEAIKENQLLRSRINNAISELLNQIDGGLECNARDSQISYIIRILEGFKC